MLSGNRLLGNYRIVRCIGSGGMGEVYVAEDTRINRQVAVKVVRTDLVTEQDTERLFRREMQAIALMDHPHILQLIDFGNEKDGNVVLKYMVMPLRQEGSLVDWLQKRGNSQKLTPNEVSHFVMQAADALQHAHDHHLIHLDVKPPNFLIRNRSGHVLPDLLLMDFGIAKINTATSAASQNVRGTFEYMAPEQWKGQPQSATDQYALAVMAYLLLTGRTPFSGSMVELMSQHFMVQPQPPSSFNSAISPSLDAVILRALEKEPAKRFPSILEFAQTFQQALQSGNNPASMYPNPNFQGYSQQRSPSAPSSTYAQPSTYAQQGSWSVQPPGYAQPAYPGTPYARPDPRKGQAVMGFIVGLVGFILLFLSWIPVLGFINLVLLILGIIFSTLGMKSTTSRGLAIAGLVLSIIGLVIVGIILIVVVYVIPAFTAAIYHHQP